MPGTGRRKPASSPAAGRKAAPTKVDLWPARLGPPAWTQVGNSCTAFAVGAAAYWIEMHKRNGRHPGVPDFPFIYKNEAFLTGYMARVIKAEKKGETTDNSGTFFVRNASWAAATFGVRFLPHGQSFDSRGFVFNGPAPAYRHFVEARRHRYDFRWIFEVSGGDPNDPVVPCPTQPSGSSHGTERRHLTVRETLLRGTPVVVGISVYQVKNWTEDARLLSGPVPRGRPDGSHVVLIVGFDDSKRAFRFRCSFGPNWTGGDRGYGHLPYHWVDDESATFGFTTFSAPGATLRRRVTLDSIRITNLGATAMDVTTAAHDGLDNYLGAQPLGGGPRLVRPGKSVVLNPVRWLDTYRLLVTATPSGSGAGPRRSVELLLDDPDGAMPSGVEVVLPSDLRKGLDGWFLGSQGGKLRTACRSMEVAGAGRTHESAP